MTIHFPIDPRTVIQLPRFILIASAASLLLVACTTSPTATKGSVAGSREAASSSAPQPTKMTDALQASRTTIGAQTSSSVVQPDSGVQTTVQNKSVANEIAFQLPKPTGPFAVGVTDLQRASMIAYYPAKPNTGFGRRAYASSGLLETYGAKKEDFSALTPYAKFAATPIRDADPRPVVILAPGGGSFIELSTSLAEDLASNGYVVIALQTDAASESGRSFSFDATPTGTVSAEDTALYGQLGDLARRAQIEDAISLLDDPVTAKLLGPIDTSRIAVGGHSLAGSTAFDAGLENKRIAAVFTLDGALFGKGGREEPRVPALALFTDEFKFGKALPDDGGVPEAAENIKAVKKSYEFVATSTKIVSVGLLEATHYAVTDLPFIIEGLAEPFRTTARQQEGETSDPASTTTTNAIMLRFISAALAPSPKAITAETLVKGLPKTTARPFEN
jgi:dienelactone hydrolase